MHASLTDALQKRGYDTLTDVQKAVTDPALGDADLLVSAQTGSGKTVGFGLAIATTLLGDADQFGAAAAPLALVVAPTRELAFQVMRELQWLYAGAGARLATCVGGMDMRDERRTLDRGAHIVVGTPGRLRDHITRGSLDLSDLRAVVLDEADEMLDLGFREDLEFMLGAAPEDRRTLLFSATVPPAIAKLAGHFQRDAVRISTTSGASQHADIAYQALRVGHHDSESAIINILRFHEATTAIVFANTRAAVARLAARFANRGFQAVTLSGELSQSERTQALQALRDGRARVCVATDVAARGIDLPNLQLVIHAELPSNAEGLLHRSGRTGRAGRKGISALIVPPKAVKKAERLLKFARITAEWTTPPSADDVLRADEARLLQDPVWQDEITGDERAFAATLLDLHAPETIAAAYLRLYRQRHTAPEDLSPPDARPSPADRAPFGPSKWIALSVGRDDRAEPRWLLPLLCRAGNIDKTAIGAIRVQDDRTLVELTEAALPGFMAALGDGGELEKGITARPADAPPERTGPKPARASRPRDDDRGSRKPRGEAPAPKSDWHPSDPKPETRTEAAPAGPAEAPNVERTAPAAPRGKPTQFAKPRAAKPASDKPRGDKPKFDGAKRPKPAPFDETRDGGVKPTHAKGDARSSKSKPKQKGDGVGKKPFRGNASDPSQRMERPGKPGGPKRAARSSGTPGAKPKARRAPGPGANDVPRRKG